MRGKMKEGWIDDRGIVMEVEGAWNLGGMGMFSCMRVGIVNLRAGGGGSGDGGGFGVDVDRTDCVGSGGGVGSAVGDGCGDNGRNVGGGRLCGGVVLVKWWGFCGSDAGGFLGRIVVWLEDGFVVLE